MSSNKNGKQSLKCFHSIRNLDFRVFRLSNDGRKWKTLCSKRFALYKDLAGRADSDGSNVFISLKTMSKSGVSIKSIERTLRELETLGCLFNCVHLDRDGKRREQLSLHGTKLRRLFWERLEIAQALLDSGSEFIGHDPLSDGEYEALRNSFSPEPQGTSDSPKGTSDSKQGTSDSRENVPKERHHGDAQPPVVLPPVINRPSQPQKSQNGLDGFDSRPTDKEKWIAETRRIYENYLDKELPLDIAESLFSSSKRKPYAVYRAAEQWLFTRKFEGLNHPEKFIGKELFARDQEGRHIYYDPSVLSAEDIRRMIDTQNAIARKEVEDHLARIHADETAAASMENRNVF